MASTIPRACQTARFFGFLHTACNDWFIWWGVHSSHRPLLLVNVLKWQRGFIDHTAQFKAGVHSGNTGYAGELAQ